MCAATSGLESGGLLKFTKLDKCVIDCCPLASSSSEVGRPSIDVDVAVQGTGSSSSSSMYCDQIISNKMCKKLSPFFNIIVQDIRRIFTYVMWFFTTELFKTYVLKNCDMKIHTQKT